MSHLVGGSSPFSFLNPTISRRPFPFPDKQREVEQSETKVGGSEDGILKPGESALSGETDEIKADDVEQKWRSRDNRKGMLPILFRHSL